MNAPAPPTTSVRIVFAVVLGNEVSPTRWPTTEPATAGLADLTIGTRQAHVQTRAGAVDAGAPEGQGRSLCPSEQLDEGAKFL